MPEVLPSVHLLDLNFQDQPATIGAYLLTAPGGEAALIETGPSSTRAALLDGIRAAGVDPRAIRDVLVTHIHLDHSGAAGVLLRDNMPEAQVWVHPAGLPHLVDPSRLLSSASRIYGDQMESLWGEVAPVPRDRVIALADSARLRLAGHEVEILFTPGHATHHVAARHLASGAVFTGDVAGARAPSSTLVNPPTVPPEFDLAAWEASISRLLVLEPPLVLLGHFGPYTDVRPHLEKLRRRLRDWTAFVRTGLAAGRSIEEMAAELHERDANTPGVGAEAIHQFEIMAPYDISIAGIARYLEKQQAKT